MWCGQDAVPVLFSRTVVIYGDEHQLPPPSGALALLPALLQVGVPTVRLLKQYRMPRSLELAACLLLEAEPNPKSWQEEVALAVKDCRIVVLTTGLHEYQLVPKIGGGSMGSSASYLNRQEVDVVAQTTQLLGGDLCVLSPFVAQVDALSALLPSVPVQTIDA